MNNKLRTKRGAISSTIADFWAYVAFVFVVLIFYAFFTFQAKDVEANQIKETQTKISNDLHLLNYLRTPIILDRNQITIAEAIAIYLNEKDSDKKKFYYEEILKKSKEILNPMEYCSTPEGRTDKNVNGYAIFVLDEKSYLNEVEFNNNFKGTKQNEDRKFRSDNFFDGLVVEKSLGVIPDNVPDKVIYLGFLISSANTFGRQVDNIRGCK